MWGVKLLQSYQNDAMQAWYERKGCKGGLLKGAVEEYRHSMLETGHGLVLSAAGL